MRTTDLGSALILAMAAIALVASIARAADAPLSEAQLVEIAVEANPAVKSARYRWDAAVHSIKQTVAPNDPIFTYTNSDSVKSPVGRAALREFNFTETFQFPGKALHQRDQAIDAAGIAHLMLMATVRDVRAATETSYFQLLLDSALSEVNAENVQNLDQVVRVAETAYSGSAVQQTDVISAEFNLAAARQLQRQYLTAVANDETTLNLQLYRPVGSPLPVDRTLKLEALTFPLDALIDRAYAARQEILEAALAERNANTALYLAKMEYLPDFTTGDSVRRLPGSQLRPKFGWRRVSEARLGRGRRFQPAGFFLDEAGRGRGARAGESGSRALRSESDKNPDCGRGVHAIPDRAVRLRNRDPVSRLSDSAGAAEFSRRADRLPGW